MSDDYVLVNRGHLDTKTYTQKECHLKMQAEIEVIPLQTKEHYRLPANHHRLGKRHGDRLSLTALKGTSLHTP